jgi:hypothetical protein
VKLRSLLVCLTLAVCSVATSLLVAAPASAAAPGLQVNPLEYRNTITGTDVRNGFVDVSNPTDTTLNIVASVQGFRQADLAGDLAFFQDAQVQQGIVLGLSQFELGPRDAIRDTFSVDPTKLPKGGVYAVIFFRTVPPTQSSSSSFVTESANIGTLLLLQNGSGKAVGSITKLSLPFWQFGSGLDGTGQYKNTDNSAAPIAFSPKLTSHILPWGRGASFTGPLVLPGSTRTFTLARPGSYFGLLPVSLTDQTNGQTVTRWVVACTGIYAFILMFLVILLGLIVGYRTLRGLSLVPRHVKSGAFKIFRPKAAATDENQPTTVKPIASTKILVTSADDQSEEPGEDDEDPSAD